MASGWRLRSQIAGILFLLFSLAMLLVGYFNVSILYEILTSQARSQLETVASNLIGFAQKRIPDDGYTPKYLEDWTASSGELISLLNNQPGLRSFHVMDSGGTVVWRFGPRSQENLPPSMVVRMLSDRKEVSTLWQFEDGGEPLGQSLESISVLHPAQATYEYYRPVKRGNRLLGAYHASLMVPDLGRRYMVVFWGNAILAFIFIVTAFIAISVWSEHAINRPLAFILQAQEKLGKGDFSARVALEVPSTNEIMTISNSFNRMSTDVSRFRAELLEKTRRLIVLNEQYRQLNERLEAEVEEKTLELREFFSMITHELKVPLAAIQGYTDLLRSKTGHLTDKQLKFLRNISTSTTHLLTLVRNMTDSVKYDAGRITYYTDDVSLPELLSEVEGHVGPLLQDKGIRLVAHLPPRCQAVLADRTKIGQVFINLISNAAHATPEAGTITIRAKDRGQTVEIVVSDTGPGIPPEHLPQLFEKFTQFVSQEGGSSGLGLGLYIVRKIVEGHGGTITVESTLGVGTSFTFSLPKGTAPSVERRAVINAAQEEPAGTVTNDSGLERPAEAPESFPSERLSDDVSSREANH